MRVKYWRVVSFKRIGVCLAAAAAIARLSFVTAFSVSGTEAWPEGPTVRGQFDGPCHLFRRFHLRQLEASRLPLNERPFGEAVFRIDRIEVLLDHEINPNSGRAFFANIGEEDRVAIARDGQPLQHDHRHQAGDDVGLVVE